MENEEKELNLFELLKKKREEQGMTLKEISQKSRIHIRYLEAIESGNYKEIPPVYDKLFFQTYLSFLDIEDKEKIVEEYRVLRGERSLSDDLADMNDTAAGSDSGNPIKKIYFVLPTIILIAIVLLLALYTREAEEPDVKQVKELSVVDVVAEYNKKEEAEKRAKQILQDSSARGGKLSVAVVGLEKTWFRVVKDYKDTSEYLIRTGNKVAITADSVMIFLVGNANGIKMAVNGKDKGKIGNKGEIIPFMKVTKKGIVAKRIKKAAVKPVKESKIDTLKNN
jgi:transcriptional regulator with XRE-family HTH domain